MNDVITLKGVITLGVITLLGFTLWRNYGVLPKNSVILDPNSDNSKGRTNEQKELINKVKNINPKDGDEVKTSFGYYTLSNGNWIKTNEIWEK